MYSTKPTIDHMFRQPEKRPSQTVSTAFTALIFVPFVVMLILTSAAFTSCTVYAMHCRICLGQNMADFFCFLLKLIPQCIENQLFKKYNTTPVSLSSDINTVGVEKHEKSKLRNTRWINIGANISNFQFSLGGIAFHIGLGGIFVLYYLFWVKLDMFSTLKYLAVIGGVTFLSANSLLSGIAARRAKR
ncbi:Dolichyl-diphosphooligosaccharide--protein glycosyltransferase subunit 2 [Exaiptasia diaphana]|nr:Dolichyl-diphosphooligosaccharide--protein glycosyltransferase subunit 2 [Exaiptasia diaphana]